MLRKTTLVFLLAIAVSGATQAHGTWCYENGHWLVDGRFLDARVCSVEGKLVWKHTGEADGVVDLQGRWIVPPYGDAHNHALGDARFPEEQKRFLANGIFYVQNPNSLLDGTRDARPEAAKAETVDVTYANGGLTATGGHPIQIFDRAADHTPGVTREWMNGQAYWIVDDAPGLERQWPRILAGEPDFLKTYLEHSEEWAKRRTGDAWYGKRGLDPHLLPAIVERAHAAGLRVTVHVATAHDFRVAVDAGADELAHLPLERLDAETARRAAERGTVVVTTTLSHRPSDGVKDLDAVHAHNLLLLREHGVRLVLGTDSDRDVLDEAENVARLVGLDPAERLDLLTRVTPRWIFPERAIGRLTAGAEASFLALAANPLEDPQALRRIELRVKRGHPIEAPAEKPGLPSVAQALMHKLMSDGTDAAIAEYRRLRSEEADAWDFSEPQLNQLGYALLQHGRAAYAEAIFRLNVEMFPTSSNVYDSLGEAQAEQGQRDEAIASYRRSLELNERNDNARERLKRLEAD